QMNLETNLPPDPTVSGVLNAQQPQFMGSNGITDITTVLLSQTLDFRGSISNAKSTQHRVANTIPATHNGGIQIFPTFLTVTGNTLETTLTQNDGAVFAYPGFNDLLTLRDVRGNDEEVRVQWGYMGWCGLTAATAQTWMWDRPQGNEGAWALRHHDARA